MEGQQYALSITFQDHEQDVRGVCALEDTNLVATSSRDRSVRVWNSLNGEVFKVLYGHEHFVGVVLNLPPSPYFSPQQPSIVSGGNDKIINVWDLESGSPYMTLIGHSESVVALSHTNGLLISGSWDKSVRVWKGTECITVLQGHQHSVWAVLGLKNGDILSGSADHTIKLWRQGMCVQTYNRHKDCVRGLADVPNLGAFLSCGNDGSIFLWTYAGEVLQELLGHTNFIYSINVLPNGEFVSTGEDNYLRIWKGGNCVQSILHPASVWCCAALSNGDVVTGCADGKARVWSKDPSRIATQDVQEAYQQQLQRSAVLTTTGNALGDIQTDKLSGPEALDIEGTKDGETKLIRTGSNVEAYKWSASNHQWLKIGEVVDARTNAAAQVLQGKQYDYIFDVDIGDGQMRKLGFNNGENPYTVAQEFLWKEELDQGFLDTVAQFIINNTKTFTIGTEAPTFRDPFTGGNRYVPGGTQTTGSSLRDPFTGAGRYIPESQAMDYTPTTVQAPKHFPVSSPLSFDTVNYIAVVNKIKEFNGQLTQNKLDDHDFLVLDSVVETLSETTRYHVSSFSEQQRNLLFSKLLYWPTNNVFPALDILRMLVLHPEGAKAVGQQADKLLPHVLSIGFSKTQPLPANQLLVLRLLCNMFVKEVLKNALVNNRERVLSEIADCVRSDNKNVRVALSTVLLNYATLFLTTPSPEGKIQCLSIIEQIISKEAEEEVLYRSLVSVGTLMWHDNEIATFVKDAGIVATLKTLESTSLSSKVRECAAEVLRL